MPATITRRLVSLNDAADALAVSTRTVRRYIADGQLEAVRLGRKTLRIKADSVERFIDAKPVGNWRRAGEVLRARLHTGDVRQDVRMGESAGTVRDDFRARLRDAFPTVAFAAASPALDLVPPAEIPPVGLVQESNNRPWPSISFQGETLAIPDRIYNGFPSRQVERLSPASRAAAGCIYTRHHDGQIRQRALELVLSHDVAWSAPFVVALLGEYVVDISVDIERFVRNRLDGFPETARGLGHFVDSNPSFMALTRARAVSYWAEYYRLDFLRMETYPALRALDVIEGARL